MQGTGSAQNPGRHRGNPGSADITSCSAVCDQRARRGAEGHQSPPAPCARHALSSQIAPRANPHARSEKQGKLLLLHTAAAPRRRRGAQQTNLPCFTITASTVRSWRPATGAQRRGRRALCLRACGRPHTAGLPPTLFVWQPGGILAPAGGACMQPCTQERPGGRQQPAGHAGPTVPCYAVCQAGGKDSPQHMLDVNSVCVGRGAHSTAEAAARWQTAAEFLCQCLGSCNTHQRVCAGGMQEGRLLGWRR